MTREDLKKMKRTNLAKMAVNAKVKGAHDMKKEDLINGICGKEVVEPSENTKTNNHDLKKHYINNASVGTLIAFKLSGGKVKSAKIVNKSTKNSKFKVVTEYGAEFVVSYSDVIWIKTGNRWPKGVYRLLKGLDKLND
jgi:DNA uptake protein ComE-like DNA-binding protein